MFEEVEKRNAFKWNDEFVTSFGEVTTEMLHRKLQMLGNETREDIVKIPDAKALMKSWIHHWLSLGLASSAKLSL